ncbi:putative zinc-binding metallopeptidase [Burkholderia multivorans]|uniref:putative zinc-binding metallopeptidase n=1 Tax=Burkholderia multivorans TaxID=87883 RepID=UPI0009BD6EBF|nr:putative zinc-binding metallopeptidase [Burkholderia multivorans]MBU9444437.1 putative zinc-binding metallopeptidase [Burkholderia multivorans]
MRDANGVITVKLADADDVARTRIRPKMREPYRTLLCHFRHGIIRPDIRRRGELLQSDATAGRADRCAQQAALQQRSTGTPNASPFGPACLIFAKHLRGTGSRGKLPYKAY